MQTSRGRSKVSGGGVGDEREVGVGMHEARIDGGGQRDVAVDAEREAIERAIERAIESVVLLRRAVTMWKCVLAVPIACQIRRRSLASAIRHALAHAITRPTAR